MKVALTVGFEWSWRHAAGMDEGHARAPASIRSILELRAAGAGELARKRRPELRALTESTRCEAEEVGGTWWRWLPACWHRARQRRVLADLDDHLLQDIGISRVQAAREARKPFWSA